MVLTSTRLRQACCVLMLWVGACGGTVSAQTIVPGRIAGTAEVGASGSALYSIALSLPPGQGGLQPQLALQYNSQIANGPLGVGWTIAGLSEITRCPATTAQDGFPRLVGYDALDRYCLDGERLMLASGAAGATGAVYRTETDRFTKVTVVLNSGNSPNSFTAQTREGLTYTYTPVAFKVGTGAGTARVWAATKIADPSGNYITVTYGQSVGASGVPQGVGSAGDYWPVRIAYTLSTTSSAPSRWVDFAVEDRPDKVEAYLANVAFTPHTKRITSITVGGTPGTTVQRKYSFSYESSPDSGRSRLKTVTECARASECLPTTTFTYKSNGLAVASAASVWTTAFGSGWSAAENYKTIRFVDLNADGLPDVCGRSSAGIVCAVNSGTALSQSTVWSTAFGTGWSDEKYYSTIQYADLNGDGLPDVCGRAAAGMVCALNNGGTAFGPATVWTSAFGAGWDAAAQYATVRLVDINNDGRADVCGFLKTHYCALNLEGTSFGASTNWRGMVSAGRLVQYVDLDGDGFPEPCVKTDRVTCGSNRARPPIAAQEFTESSGLGGVSAYPSSWAAAEYVSTVQYADVNGDGFVDACWRVVVGFECTLNKGVDLLRLWTTPTLWTSAFGAGWSAEENYSTIRMVDANGDGVPDLCGRATTGIRCALGNGNGFSGEVVWTASFGAGWSAEEFYRTVTFVDVNGDGALDICGRSAAGIECALGTATATDLLVTVSPVAGSTAMIQFSYRSLVDRAVYTKDSGANAAQYPVVDVVQPALVVRSVDTFGGGGTGAIQRLYAYGGLKAEVGGRRGFLGFRWTRVQTFALERATAIGRYPADFVGRPIDGLEEYREFRQDWPYTGRASLMRQSVTRSNVTSADALVPVSSAVLRTTTHQYGCQLLPAETPCAVAPDNVYFVYLRESTDEFWDLDGTALPGTTSRYEYSQSPQYGYPTRIFVGRSDGSSKTTVNEYWPASTSGGKWISGRLKTATVTSTAP